MFSPRHVWLIRGAFLKWWVTVFGGSVGRNFMVDRGAVLRRLPHRGIRIGDNVYLGRGTILDVPRGGRLDIGSHVLINHYSVVAAAESVSIGDHTQIAEHCSIRDSNHGMLGNELIRKQPLQSSPTRIGADVWIARGVAVLRGVNIGSGAVIGANAAVTKDVPSGAIAVGIPARVSAWRQTP